MDETEAVALAKKAALERGLVWEEPVTVNRKKSYLFFGPLYWEIITAAHTLGASLIIRISDTDRRVEINNLPR